MSDQALLIGINEYREQPLRGCVNDVVDLATFLVERAGFAREGVTLLLDGRATRAAILHHVRELVRSVRPGDRALLHFSGHGVQLPIIKDDDEADGLDEAICPVDYSWDDLGSFLRDDDFRRELARLPPDATFVWISDSCHSATMTRELSPTAAERRPRSLTPPSDLAWKVETQRSRKVHKQRGFRVVAEELHLAFVAGCQADKTSADAVFSGRPNGALTYFLLRELEKADGLSVLLPSLVSRVTQALGADRFEQVPSLEGHPRQQQRAFLAEPPVGAGVAAPWLELFAELERRAAADAGFRGKLMQATSAASRELAPAFGVDLSKELPAVDERSARGGTVVRAFWWGFHIQISHQDLQALLGVADPINQLAVMIGPVTGPAAPFVLLAATFVAGALALLRSLDRGRGVYVSMSWFAPGIFVPTSV